MIEVKAFGVTKTGEEIQEYILKNKNGMEVHVINFGATIKNIFVPDREGNLADVILGFDDISGYEGNELACHGAVIGRVANRIGEGRFTLNGVEYKLDINNAGNCLHGGNNRYETKVYKAYPDEKLNSVTMKRIDPHMSQGFPGNLNLSVEYTLTENNELIIAYEARSDKDTPLNITNHGYYNLKGCSTMDLTTHEIMIRSHSITETDDDLLPNGKYIDITGTPMDFRERRPFVDRVEADFLPLKQGKGFDHNYVIDHQDGEPDAVVIETTSGRKMELYTEMPGVQFYTANWLSEEEIGKGGVPHQAYGAFCLETQFYPNSCNIPSFPNAILKEGEKYRSVTKYVFGIAEEIGSPDGNKEQTKETSGKEKKEENDMNENTVIEDLYEEYITFHVTAKDGSDVEMAVVDEFDYDHKHYVVGAVVKDDVIDEEGQYIYRCKVQGEDFTAEKITDKKEYEAVVNAYMEME